MPKVIKGNAGRKPPEPAADHSDIDSWFHRQMPRLQPILRELDEVIRSATPGLHYAVKWKRPYYGLPDRGWIIELAAYDVSVNVVFFGGADFTSPPPLGTTGRARCAPRDVSIHDLLACRQPRATPRAPLRPSRLRGKDR